MEARTWRLSLLGGIMGVSVPFGTLISAYIYASGGNIDIWGTALALYTVAILYILFGFADSSGTSSVAKMTEDKTIEKFRFDEKKYKRLEMAKESCVNILNNLIRCFTETFKPRPGYKRACVSILMASMCLALFANGEKIKY